MNVFGVNTKTYCGFGITKSALDEILEQFESPLVIFDASLQLPDYFPKIIDNLDCPRGEPTYNGLEDLRYILEGDQSDCIIGFGGGSAMDYAKALAALANEAEMGPHYRGFDKIEKEGIPCICIPTTAGTGSEITPNAVFTDTETKTKLGINGRYVAAQYAILDGQWLETCPKEAATSALLDAFVHAIESYMSPKATELTRALSREAFRLLYSNALEKTLEGKQNLLYGAYLAAMALCNTTSGVCGAMSYPLGVHFNIPHGYAGGIFLPDLVEFNEIKGYEYNLLSVRLSYALRDLWMRLEVPKTLHQWGVKERAYAYHLMDGISFDGRNPIPFTLQDAKDLIARHV